MDTTEFLDWLGGIGRLSRQQLRQTFQALALYECASADVAEVSEVSAVNAQITVSVEEFPAASVGIEVSALQPSSRDGTQTLSEAVRQRVEITGCPHCGSHDITLWGRSHGLPRYRCKSCKRTFNALTKTPLAGLRMKDKWLEHSRAMIDGLSLSKTAERCGVHHTTAFRWRHRFLDCLSNDKPTTLSGIVESDEMFILESYKGKRRDMPRAPRKRGGKATKPGLSDEQIPVIVARDRSGATTDAVLPKLNRVSITAALGGVVTSANQFCCDGGTAIMAFARRAAIPTHVLPSPGKPMPEAPDFHINNINAYHSRFKGWMRRFHGVATKNLPNYLGWRRTQEALGAKITPTDWILAAIGLGPYQQQTR